MASQTTTNGPLNLPSDPDEFEEYVKNLLETSYGYKVIKPPKNQQGYDLEVIKNGRSIAVQVKNWQRNISTPEVHKFLDFMRCDIETKKFNEGWLISSRGFGKAAITNLVSECEETSGNSSISLNVSLGTIRSGKIDWDYCNRKNSVNQKRDSPPISPSVDHPSNNHAGESRRYFGIFTNKGGTGKTTVAAHLAGAFALMGYDVVLLDLDPQGNLIKLFQNDSDGNQNDNDSGMFIKSPWPKKPGATIHVLTDKQWQEFKDDHNDAKIIICDCNPTLRENSDSLFKKFNYCVIPTTLNPLGIAKNSDVITRTFESIRGKNNETEMFVLVNYFEEDNRNENLLNLLKTSIKSYLDKDNKSYLIDPTDCAIHRSKSLYYWGLHLITKGKPELAFKSHGGKSIPRTDFFALAEYLEGHDGVSLTKT